MNRCLLLIMTGLLIAGLNASLAAAEAATTPPATNSPSSVSSQPTSVPPAVLQAVQSLVQLRIYGYIKLDGAYDTSRVQTGDIIYYVLPKNSGVSDNEFNMTTSYKDAASATDNRFQGSVIYRF